MDKAEFTKLIELVGSFEMLVLGYSFVEIVIDNNCIEKSDEQLKIELVETGKVRIHFSQYEKIFGKIPESSIIQFKYLEE